jgi:hypothetical protein
MRRRTIGALAGIAALAGLVLVAQALSTGSGKRQIHFSKLAAAESAEATPGEGPVGTYDEYLAAQLAYPAADIPPTLAAAAEATFEAIAKKDAKNGDPKAQGRKWKLVGPTQNATEPGVLAFSGATNNTASRTVALAIDPDCGKRGNSSVCRLWAGTSGGGVWLTKDATAADPDWKQLGEDDLDQTTIGAITLDPTDKKNDTLYVGTGEGSRCGSGCGAGAGLYKSTDGGIHWNKLDSACVSNATYPCVNPGKDSFLARGINSIVIDPRNGNHIFVGSTLAVRGLSHVIGAGGGTRIVPGANLPGVYESADGGKTFTMVWNGNAGALPAPGSFGITDVGLDPSNPDVVYAAGFDAGVWRRDAGAAQTAFVQVFRPQFVPPLCGNPAATPQPATCPFSGTDRAMFALTKLANGHTRIYLTEGTNASTGVASQWAANFWRTDMADQPAATLLASQTAGYTAPDPATHLFPQTYTGWQNLTAKATGSPYFATDDFCTAQCWYDQDVVTPDGQPNTVYVIGSYYYGEVPCNTKGVGCGNGRSNGRAVIHSTTAGDPDGANNMRTFTDNTFDTQNNPATWCAFAPYFDNGCVWAPNSIHPDQHEVLVNPSNPNQIFSSSDGGVIRTDGTFQNTTAACDEPHRNGGAPLPNTSGSYLTCQRMLSRVPTLIEHIVKTLSSTIQFVNVAINPNSTCELMGGTQDNGTWSNNSGCDNDTWNQVIYGDGGNAGYDKATSWRFNEFTSGASDSNFRPDADPEKWVITSAPVVRSGEAPAFYWPQIADPNPVPGAHPIFSGAKHVWRTWAFGAGHQGAVPQDKNPDVALYESTCQEFVVSSSAAACGDYRPMGGPYCEGAAACVNAPGDLTGTVYGADRAGGVISWLARTSSDHGTLWAATAAGRLFVTHNADAADPAAVTWHRIDNATSPTRYPSGIYVDPADSSHAWVSYSGFNANTPSTPGHLFDVHENGRGTAAGSGVFVNLNVENGTKAYPTPNSDGDLPLADVVRDDANKILYVATDFGVLRGDDDGAEWHVTAGMPRYEVMHLEIQPGSRVATCEIGGKCKRTLYAATHSQGIWSMKLDKD